MNSPVTAPARSDLDRLSAVADEVHALREDVEHAVEGAGEWDHVHPDHRDSAINLVQYLKLRQHDVRDLQTALADLGLSSLGRLEAQVAPTIAAVDRAIRRQLRGPDASSSDSELDTHAAASLIDRNADRLLGTPRDGRRTRILVTMPSEAAADRLLVDRIVRSGIEAVRINCAHDGPEAWREMIDNVRATERAQGVSIKILMDLAGPKLRTGPIMPGPEVVKVKPTRDGSGRVITPAYVWLSASVPAPEGALHIPVDDVEWLTERRVGEEIRCTDARGSKRRLRVVRTGDGGLLAEVARTCYFATGMALRSRGEERADVGVLPATEQKLVLRDGDLIHLVPDLTPVDPARDGLRIGCTLPAVFTDVQIGERVYFDDGKVGGIVESVAPDDIAVRVNDIAPTGAKLAAEKGINLPDTTLNLPALTEEDLTNLDFAAEHADVVSLSFVRTADDVALLQRELHERGAADTGIVLKIETVAGIANLPQILLQALRSQRVGIMIARGDLAIEAGYERLAEVQEEIMWLCEAAHVPAIFATQVLDTLAKTGHPSRAEVTDAAMSGRAECVMLNKGPYVANAVRLLSAILRRMAEHHTKKRALMRRIVAWSRDPD